MPEQQPMENLENAIAAANLNTVIPSASTDNDEMKSKGWKFCKDFLGGAWEKVSLNDITMDRITGSTSNYIYKCSLRDHIRVENGEPRAVIIRFYGSMSEGDAHMVLKEAVVFAMLAERHIGPNLFGIFRGGRVEEYIPSRCLRAEEMAQPAVSIEIAQKMARLHQLNMPIKKEPKWLFGNINRWLTYIYDKLWTNEEFMQARPGLQKIQQLGLREELAALRSFLNQVPSQVVFCHNDFQEGNLLRYEDPEQGTGLVTIDFEYCSYNFRGFDFGNHFCEWAFDNNSDEAPYFTKDLASYPSRDKQKVFFRAYLDELHFQGDVESELEKLCVEADTYSLASHFFWAVWSIVSSENSQLPFGYVEYCEERLDTYFLFKDRWLENRCVSR